MSLTHITSIVILLGGLIYGAELLNVTHEWNAVGAIIVFALLVMTRIRVTLTHKVWPDSVPPHLALQPALLTRYPSSYLVPRPEAARLHTQEALMNAKPVLSDVSTLRLQARKHIQEGAVTASYTADRAMVLKLLNEALATEIICVLRYRRHHFMARGIHAKGIATEFLVHANEEQGHADQIAERIVQLGGEPDFSPDTLSQRSHAVYVPGKTLADMIRENLIAERIAIDSYREMIQYLSDQDSTTSQMLKGILAVEEKHADELADLLEDLPTSLTE